ncbi:MAG: hypothetical protein ACLUG4_00860 [Bacilli bacterium]|jgi:hypothetical protein|nr:hypothetical protein [Staphylococcus sp.]
MLNFITSITPTRTFNLLYIILDTIFVIVLLILLFIKQKKIPFILLYLEEFYIL